jgi:hypothetical protein
MIDDLVTFSLTRAYVKALDAFYAALPGPIPDRLTEAEIEAIEGFARFLPMPYKAELRSNDEECKVALQSLGSLGDGKLAPVVIITRLAFGVIIASIVWTEPHGRELLKSLNLIGLKMPSVLEALEPLLLKAACWASGSDEVGSIQEPLF